MAAPVQEQPERTIPMEHRPWTVAEWVELPESKTRVELVDGMLFVSPIEASGNARLMLHITRSLADSAPDGLEVMSPINVGLGGTRVLIPDFCITDAPGLNAVVVPARCLVLVGEIASPSTRVYDRTTKRALYAEAGIPFLMFVDPDPPSAVLLELHEGEYVEVARSVDGRLELPRPFPVTLDLTPPAPPPAG